MFAAIFKKGPTTRADIFFTVLGLLAAAWKVYDTTRNYHHEQAALNKEIQ